MEECLISSYTRYDTGVTDGVVDKFTKIVQQLKVVMNELEIGLGDMDNVPCETACNLCESVPETDMDSVPCETACNPCESVHKTVYYTSIVDDTEPTILYASIPYYPISAPNPPNLDDIPQLVKPDSLRHGHVLYRHSEATNVPIKITSVNNNNIPGKKKSLLKTILNKIAPKTVEKV